MGWASVRLAQQRGYHGRTSHYQGKAGGLTMKTATSSTTKKPASKIGLATPVSQRVELENIILTETAARRKPARGGLPASISINVSVQTDADKVKRLIQVRPHFVLVARFDDESGDELLRLEAAFLLHYRVPSLVGLRKTNITAFGELNGLYNAWPYWREFVQATTVRMGLPSLTIPVLQPLATKASRKKDSASRTSQAKPARRKRVAAAAR